MPVASGSLSSADIVRMLDRLSDGIIVLSPDWQIRYLNAPARRMTRREDSDPTGKHAWTEFPDVVGHPIQIAYEEAMRSGRPRQLVEYFAPSDRWFEIRIFPYDDQLVAFFRDATEEQRSETVLREQAERIAEAERIVGFGVWRWDVASGRVGWSDQLHRIYGLEPGEFEGTVEAFMERVHPRRPRAGSGRHQPLAGDARGLHLRGADHPGRRRRAGSALEGPGRVRRGGCPGGARRRLPRRHRSGQRRARTRCQRAADASDHRQHPVDDHRQGPRRPLPDEQPRGRAGDRHLPGGARRPALHRCLPARDRRRPNVSTTSRRPAKASRFYGEVSMQRDGEDRDLRRRSPSPSPTTRDTRPRPARSRPT